MKYITVYEYDDTDFEGHHLAKVKLSHSELHNITKAIFEIGKVQIEIVNPVFPFYVDLNQEDYEKLQCSNQCFLILYDSENKRKTIDLKTFVEVKKRG